MSESDDGRRMQGFRRKSGPVKPMSNAELAESLAETQRQAEEQEQEAEEEEERGIYLREDPQTRNKFWIRATPATRDPEGKEIPEDFRFGESTAEDIGRDRAHHLGVRFLGTRFRQ